MPHGQGYKLSDIKLLTPLIDSRASLSTAGAIALQ